MHPEAEAIETNVFRHRTTTTAYRYNLNKNLIEQLSDAIFHLYDEDEMLSESDCCYDDCPSPSMFSNDCTTMISLAPASSASGPQQYSEEGGSFADTFTETNFDTFLDTPLPLSFENILGMDDLEMISEILNEEKVW